MKLFSFATTLCAIAIASLASGAAAQASSASAGSAATTPSASASPSASTTSNGYPISVSLPPGVTPAAQSNTHIGVFTTLMQTTTTTYPLTRNAAQTAAPMIGRGFGNVLGVVGVVVGAAIL